MSSTMMNGLNYFDLYYTLYIYIFLYLDINIYCLMVFEWQQIVKLGQLFIYPSYLSISLSLLLPLSLSLFENLNLTNCSINWAGRSHFLGLFQTNLNLLPTIKFRPFPPTFYYWLVVGCWLLVVVSISVNVYRCVEQVTVVLYNWHFICFCRLLPLYEKRYLLLFAIPVKRQRQFAIANKNFHKSFDKPS